MIVVVYCFTQGAIYAKDMLIEDINVLSIVPFADYLVHIIFYASIKGQREIFYVLDVKTFVEVKPP